MPAIVEPRFGTPSWPIAAMVICGIGRRVYSDL